MDSAKARRKGRSLANLNLTMGRGQNLGASSGRKLVGAIAPALQSRGERAEADQLRRQHGLKTEAESRERVELGNPESHGAK